MTMSRVSKSCLPKANHAHHLRHGTHHLMVRTLRYGHDNPGLTPGVDISIHRHRMVLAHTHTPTPRRMHLDILAARDALAERSKAVAKDTIPKGRRFEPHRRHSGNVLPN